MTAAVPDPRFRDQLAGLGAHLIASERRRQIEVEGYTTEHDFRHPISDFHRAALAYLQGDASLWPWADGFKPKGRRADLVRAGALFEAAAVRFGTGARAAEMRSKRDGCAQLIDELLIDAADVLLPLVEARVQAAANQRAAEDLGEAIGIATTRGPLDAVAWMARRHAALASPAPVPPDANGGEER